MKKLKNLQINLEKVKKNKELIILRGGYNDGKECHCLCWSRTPIPEIVTIMAAVDQAQCTVECNEIGCDGTWNCTY